MATTLAQSYTDILGWITKASTTQPPDPQSIKNLRSVMADDIVLKKVLHPDSVSGGADTVKSYLAKDMFLGGAVFTAQPAPTAYPKYYFDAATEAASTYGNIRGIGSYVDETGDAPIAVAWVWSFKRAAVAAGAAANDWKFVHAFGCPITDLNSGF
jgi:hypothetical protein